MLVALTPFEALCGFRDPGVSADVLAALDLPSLTPVVDALRRGADGLRDAVAAAADLAGRGPARAGRGSRPGRGRQTRFPVRREPRPGDGPGIALSRRPGRAGRAAAQPRAPGARRGDLDAGRQPARLPARRRHRDHGGQRQRPARRPDPEAGGRRRAAAGAALRGPATTRSCPPPRWPPGWSPGRSRSGSSCCTASSSTAPARRPCFRRPVRASSLGIEGDVFVAQDHGTPTEVRPGTAAFVAADAGPITVGRGGRGLRGRGPGLTAARRAMPEADSLRPQSAVASNGLK